MCIQGERTLQRVCGLRIEGGLKVFYWFMEHFSGMWPVYLPPKCYCWPEEHHDNAHDSEKYPWERLGIVTEAIAQTRIILRMRTNAICVCGSCFSYHYLRRYL